MIYLADKVVSDNNLKEKITLIRGNPENSKEKLQPADIIISDWMGYFLMHDSNIESVIYARDNCLKKEGVLIPDSAIIHIAAIEDEELFNSKYRFWENVHDIDMSLIKNASLSEVLVETAEKEKILSSIFKIYELDLYTAQENDLEFSTKYQLTITKSQKMHGLISWFDVFMNSLPYKVKFNTSPFNQSTSWKQCIFYLDEELQVEKGDILNGSFAFRNSLENEYHLDFKISFHLFRKNVNIYNKIKLYKLRI
jgi:protein arginine N-methyltransferase 1